MTCRKLTESSKNALLVGAMRASQVWLALMCLMVLAGHCLPLDPHQAAKEKEKEMEERLKKRMEGLPKLPDFPGADKEEYKRYWEEAVKSNPSLHERLERIRNFHPENLADLHPRLGERMARNSEEVRSRLEEARRMTVEDMRNLQKLQMLRESKHNEPGMEWMERREAMRENLPPHFTDDQLQQRLKERQRILEELDNRRREDFKRYEMQMEHKRRMKLREMDEQKRLNAEQEFHKEQEKRKHHEQLKHPASKEQLEEVWRADDGMTEEEFRPKTFFMMHDTNSDNHLDQMELEGLFYGEVKKVYGDDMQGMEAHEEMARMREHVLTEVDKNRDGLVSLQEFMQYTEGKGFENHESWKPIVDEPDQMFDEKDFDKYEHDYDEYYDYEYDEHGNIIGAKPPTKKEHEQQPGEHGQRGEHGQQPGGHEQQPGTHGQQPGGHEQQLGTHGQQPGAHGQPGEHGQQPGTHEQQPGTHGQQPGAHGQPGEHGQQPGTHEQQPGTHGQQPGGHGQPGTHGQQPGGHEQQQPGVSAPSPHHEEQKPTGDKGTHPDANAVNSDDHAQQLSKTAQEEHAPNIQGNQKQV